MWAAYSDAMQPLHHSIAVANVMSVTFLSKVTLPAICYQQTGDSVNVLFTKRTQREMFIAEKSVNRYFVWIHRCSLINRSYKFYYNYLESVKC